MVNIQKWVCYEFYQTLVMNCMNSVQCLYQRTQKLIAMDCIPRHKAGANEILGPLQEGFPTTPLVSFHLQWPVGHHYVTLLLDHLPTIP